MTKPTNGSEGSVDNGTLEIEVDVNLVQILAMVAIESCFDLL